MLLWRQHMTQNVDTTWVAECEEDAVLAMHKFAEKNRVSFTEVKSMMDCPNQPQNCPDEQWDAPNGNKLKRKALYRAFATKVVGAVSVSVPLSLSNCCGGTTYA